MSGSAGNLESAEKLPSAATCRATSLVSCLLQALSNGTRHSPRSCAQPRLWEGPVGAADVAAAGGGCPGGAAARRSE